MDADLIARVFAASRPRPIRRLYVGRERCGCWTVNFRLPQMPWCAGINYRAEHATLSEAVEGARVALAVYAAGWRVPGKIVLMILGKKSANRLAWAHDSL